MAREELFQTFIEELKPVLSTITDEKVLKYVLDKLLRELIINKCWIFEHCESPIEQMMAAALIEAFEDDHLYINPQEEVDVGKKKYRVDFMIQPHYHDPRGEFKIAVECDGHDFHEKTKEQAARDKARDRSIQAKGIPVLRFTGSEIWNEPMKCANEVRSFTLDHISRIG